MPKKKEKKKEEKEKENGEKLKNKTKINFSILFYYSNTMGRVGLTKVFLFFHKNINKKTKKEEKKTW